MFWPFILVVFDLLFANQNFVIANGKLFSYFKLIMCDLSNFFPIKIDAPRLFEFKNSYSQPVNSRFVINCNYISGVAPLKFFWTKNGHSIPQSSDSRIKIDVDDDFSMITIKNIKIDDAGNYSCTVQNRFGIDSQWSMLQVKGDYYKK